MRGKKSTRKESTRSVKGKKEESSPKRKHNNTRPKKTGQKILSQGAFRKSEEQFREALSISTVGVMFWRKDNFTLGDMNEAFLQMTGFSREEALGKTWQEFTPLEFHPISNKALEELATRGEISPFEKQYYRKDGSRWWGLFNGRDVGDYAIEFVVDITTRKETEEALRKSEEKYRTLFDTTSESFRDTQLLRDLGSRLLSEENIDTFYHDILEVAIKLTNADAGTIQLYDKATKQLHLATVIGLGKDVTDHFQSVDAASNTSCGIALTRNERVFLDFDDPDLDDPDGSLRIHVDAGIFSAQSTPLTSRSDQPIGMLNTHFRKQHNRPTEHQLRFIDLLARQIADLIEQRQAQKALRQSEEALKQFNIQLEQQVKERTDELNDKNKQLQHTVSQLESFNYIASHDLQEPLRKIQTFIELLNEHEIKDPGIEEYIRGINVSSARMSDLINSLLQYSRLSGSMDAFQPVDFEKILDNVKTDYEIAIQEKHATIVNGNLPTIRAIPFQMHQLFANLISNSLKFCHKQPEIKISSRIISGNEIKGENGFDAKTQYAELIFSDNGIGFDNKYNKKIFEVFQRLHNRSNYSGTGIGLSIVDKIVKQHYGFIKAEGNEKGAVFTVYLPVA